MLTLRQGQWRLVAGVFGSVLVDPVAKRALVHAYLAGNLGDRT